MDGDRAGPGAYGTEELEGRESRFRVSEVDDSDAMFRLPYGKFNCQGKNHVSDADSVSQVKSGTCNYIGTILILCKIYIFYCEVYRQV